MPGALSYLIEKVEGLEKTAQSLLNRQEDCCSSHWMDVDELCNYIPSTLFHKKCKRYEEENSSCYPHPPGLDRNNQVSFPTNKLERLS